MQEPPDFEATIHHPQRRQHWLSIFGTDTLPIRSPILSRANLPGYPGALIYEVDLATVTPDQRRRLIDHLAEKFGYDPAYVRDTLDRHGLPVLAEEVTVTVRRPELFL